MNEAGTGEAFTTKGTVNPLENIQYTDKVLNQMSKGAGEHHSFPPIVDNYGALGDKTPLIGGDGVTRTKIEIPGQYNGQTGVFQYIIEPDGVTVNHRLFVPTN